MTTRLNCWLCQLGDVYKIGVIISVASSLTYLTCTVNALKEQSAEMQRVLQRIESKLPNYPAQTVAGEQSRVAKN